MVHNYYDYDAQRQTDAEEKEKKNDYNSANGEIIEHVKTFRLHFAWSFDSILFGRRLVSEGFIFLRSHL